MHNGMADKKTTLTLHVQPNVRQNEVLGFEAGILRLKIAAPPVDGKANKELIALLSKRLGVSKSSITIDRGQTGKNKIVSIVGLTRDQIYELIETSRKK
jgi:uncharacterized protein (TIGR00251 family)